MKKLMIVPALVAMLAGCETTMKLPNGETAQPLGETAQPLLVAMQKDCHPNRGDKFVHDGDRIEVLQVLQTEGFVLAHKEINLRRGDDILDRGLTIRVDTKDDYAKDEFLRPGVYEYIGTYTYETSPIINGVKTKGTNTVRVFKQVSDK